MIFHEPKLVADFPNAQFWHGDSIAHRIADKDQLIVADPPAALADKFWPAMIGTDRFVIFAGLKGNARIIGAKLLSCVHFAMHETDNNSCHGDPAQLHTAREYGSLRPQHVIARTAISTSITIPQGLRILDQNCDDCLLPEFIHWAVDQYVNFHSYDTIYDPFCGSGSTAIAAHSLGKKFVGMDLDLDRVHEAAKKYVDFTIE